VNSNDAPCLTSEAARVLKVSADTVRTWADAGRLTVWRTSAGLRVFDRAELERVAADRAAKEK
jgi:excisionase family DNA binding protein